MKAGDNVLAIENITVHCLHGIRYLRKGARGVVVRCDNKYAEVDFRMSIIVFGQQFPGPRSYPKIEIKKLIITGEYSMKLEIKRYGLRILPEDRDGDARDTAFIEEVLGLKQDGDSVLLTRKNSSGLSCIAYLETITKKPS